MRAALSNYLLAAYRLLCDQARFRGESPGAALERDLQAVAEELWLRSEHRVRHGPHGGVYYSGLRPETDLFVYDGPEFLRLEAKDWTSCVGRAVPTEFWARALDLHLGRARGTLPDACAGHYPVLVVAGGATDELRAACMRWGISLLEPARVPLAVLARAAHSIVGPALRQAGCSADELRRACMCYGERYPRRSNGVLVTFGRVASRSTVAALLRFQRIATESEVDENLGLCPATSERHPRRGLRRYWTLSSGNYRNVTQPQLEE